LKEGDSPNAKDKRTMSESRLDPVLKDWIAARCGSNGQSVSDKSTIAVIYLARKAEGLEPLRSFIQSYQTHPAGIDHDLVVVFKGFENDNDLKTAQSLFSSLPIISLELPDEGFDIGSYFAASQKLAHEYIVCLNTFSRILADDWLLKFYTHASLPDVGIVGATGSYEGLRDPMKLISTAQWLNSQPGIHTLLRHSLQKYAGSSQIKKYEQVRFRRKVRINSYALFFFCKLALKFIERKIPAKLSFSKFPLFPNPHLRSNAFFIRRELFLSLKKRAMKKKIDAYFFECGRKSMTRQILSAGLKAYVMGKNGIAYDILNWPKSDTFRTDQQVNLLISDNQTELFKNSTEEDRLFLQLISWGKTTLLNPSQFSSLATSFDCNLIFPTPLKSKKLQK
jgi:hypothetical protein